jgi:uncharacterized membrane protein
MEYRTTVTVDAPAPRLWAVLTDLASWPQWTPTMTSVEPLAGVLGPGARVRIRQPGLLPATWRVTHCEEGRRFTWETARPGYRLVADHLLDPRGPATEVTLAVDLSGPLSRAIEALWGTRMRRMVDQEAAGLRHRSEQESPG